MRWAHSFGSASPAGIWSQGRAANLRGTAGGGVVVEGGREHGNSYVTAVHVATATKITIVNL